MSEMPSTGSSGDEKLIRSVLEKHMSGVPLEPEEEKVLNRLLQAAEQDLFEHPFRRVESPEYSIKLSPEEQAVLDVNRASGKQASAAWHKQEEREARKVLSEA